MNNRDIAILLERDTYSGSACRLGHTVKLTKSRRCEECEAMQELLPKPQRRSTAIKPPHIRTDKERATAKAYYEKHKVKLRAARDKWYQDNKAMRNEYMKEWRRRNLDKPYYSSRAKPKDKI